MDRRRLPTARIAPVALTLIVALLLAACSGGDPVATPTATVPAAPSGSTATADPTATPEVSSVAPYALPTREVPFTVQLPAGTTGPVSVRVFGVSEFEIARSVALSQADGDRWTGSVPLEEGALVRYAYDRGTLEDFPSFIERREAPALALDTTWRIIHVAPDLAEVNDTVAMWADERATVPSGSVSGVITDSVTGDPVMDAEVSVTGMHTATDYDGSYRFSGVAAGEHVVTVHRATGDYKAISTPVTVRAGAEAAASLAVEPARRVTVQIQAIIPEDMPAGATVKVYGNAWQLGGHFYTAPGQPEGLRLPVGRAVRGRETERVQFAFDLYEGQPVSYRYTLAGPGLSSELRLDGEQAPRSFIASRASRVRVDEIEAFRPADQTEVVLRAEVPANTPEGVPIQFVMGPGHWMTEDEDGAWSTVLYGRPGDTLTYALRLGDDVEAGADSSAGAPLGRRTIEIPEADTALAVAVTDWVGRPGVAALADGELAEVEFRVTVPASTTDGDSTLRLVGTGELGEGIDLTVVPGTPTLYVGSASLPAGNYIYDVRRMPADPDGDPIPSAHPRNLEISLVEHVVNDWVSGWSAEIPNVQPRDDRFRGGYYLPDFWSPGFEALTRSTIDVIEERPNALAALSSVWSYGQVRPEPTVESRSLFAPSVATPLEALVEQAAEARRGEVPVILAPQFNPEMTADGASLGGPKSQQWIDAWLREAERLWLWNAEVADAINADILLLPGPTFHVFDQPSAFPSTESFEDFDQSLIALIGEVRDRYDGRLLISGGQTTLEAPGLADVVGVTTFDTGHPALAATATVDQWRVAYEALFDTRLDPIHDAWERPIFLYQLQVPSTPSPGDPTGEFAQARQLEGLLQALSNRTWIVGALSWSYGMIEVPDLATDSLRGRLAEAVLSKHYELFNPADISAITMG